MSTPTLQERAYHEAGHAVALWLLGHKLDVVTIKAEGGVLGYVDYASDPIDGGVDLEGDPDEIIDPVLKNMIFQTLAGDAAQKLFNPDLADDLRDTGGYSDYESAADILHKLGENDLGPYEDDAVTRIREVWPKVETVAEALLKEETINYPRFQELIDA